MNTTLSRSVNLKPINGTNLNLIHRVNLQLTIMEIKCKADEQSEPNINQENELKVEQQTESKDDQLEHGLKVEL